MVERCIISEDESQDLFTIECPTIDEAKRIQDLLSLDLSDFNTGWVSQLDDNKIHVTRNDNKGYVAYLIADRVVERKVK